jgi:hypothetical protein
MRMQQLFLAYLAMMALMLTVSAELPWQWRWQWFCIWALKLNFYYIVKVGWQDQIQNEQY